MGQNGGVPLYAAQTVLQSPVYTALIPKSKFPTGILQLTLFTAMGEPVCERIVFVNHNDQLSISATVPGKTFATRQRVQFKVLAKSKSLPVESSLSVSVIDESKVPVNENTETTILTSLLLTSDLKGYIEKPNYYFLNPNDKTNDDLDVLMLTQGYRRLNYRDVLAGKLPKVYFLPEQGIEVAGTLRSATGLPIAKGNVRLLIPDKNFSTQTTTDMSGNFKFTKLVLTDSSQITINARNNVGSNNMMIMMAPQSLQGLLKNVNAPDEILNIDSAISPYLQNTKRLYNNKHTLKEVEITSKVVEKKPSHEDYPELTGLSMIADHEISGDRLKDCPNFASCLQTMVFGLTYNDNNYYVTRDYNAGKKTPVQIFYNGMPVDYSYLNNINSADVASVEIFLKDDVSGINRRYNTNGILVINGKKVVKTKVTAQQLRELFPPKYLLTFTPKGYDISREFYSPKYGTAPNIAQRNDLRSTIYWNPKVFTDKTGAASFEFYNSDGKGSYRAVIEGIDNDGNIGRFVYRYKVE